MEFILVNGLSVLRDEVANKQCTRNTVAQTVALLIRAKNAGEKIDFAEVNKMILARWSKSGLEYIKKRAWKILEENT